MGEFQIFFLQARHLDFGPHQKTDGRKQRDFVVAVAPGSAVLKVDHPHNASAAQERNGEERLKTILRKLVKQLKPRVAASVLRYGDGLPVLCDPSRNALAQLQLQTAYNFGMGVP